MALWNRRTRTPSPPVERATPPRKGLDPDIPQGGTSVEQQSTSSVMSRRQDMDDLYGAYTGCAPASAGVDVIARTVTAGGLEVVPDSDNDEKLTSIPSTLPAGVQGVQDLLDWVNPYEDIRQLARNVIVDLLVTGDAFIEVTWAMGVPYALWHLDSATMIPIADPHGTVTKYVQDVGYGQRAEFKPEEVIHIRFDAPRGGVYGLSPIRKLQPVIVAYMWTTALLKATMKKGNPPRFHMAAGPAADETATKRWEQQYPAKFLGPDNLGKPLVTKTGTIQEFKESAIAEYLTTLADLRDIILSGLGVPGRKVGVAEKGALGGAGVEIGEDRTFHLNTCHPLAELVLEKLNFTLLRAFGVDGWRIRFGEVDYRDDLTKEHLRDLRLRNGSWTLNRYRDDIDEPGVEGGDLPILVDRQNLTTWADMPALSRANVEAVKAKGTPTGSLPPTAGNPVKPADDDDGGTPPNPTGGEALRAQWAKQLAERTRLVLAEIEP